jgi:hypothetical protein
MADSGPGRYAKMFEQALSPIPTGGSTRIRQSACRSSTHVELFTLIYVNMNIENGKSCRIPLGSLIEILLPFCFQVLKNVHEFIGAGIAEKSSPWSNWLHDC